MLSYNVRAYDAEGRFLFGATLRAEGDAAAKQKFGELPMQACKPELWRQKRRVALRAPLAQSRSLRPTRCNSDALSSRHRVQDMGARGASLVRRGMRSRTCNAPRTARQPTAIEARQS
jgi:hypothetical protein